jgi:hypothetical protein
MSTWSIFTAVWDILYGYFVYIFPFWYVVPRKIWQPCSWVFGYRQREREKKSNIFFTANDTPKKRTLKFLSEERGRRSECFFSRKSAHGISLINNLFGWQERVSFFCREKASSVWISNVAQLCITFFSTLAKRFVCSKRFLLPKGVFARNRIFFSCPTRLYTEVSCGIMAVPCDT